jgi:hypothetical protein
MMMRIWAALALMLAINANAVDLSAISSKEAGQGLREALTRGAEVAVDKLAATDGFLGNERVRIPLPANLARAEKMLRRIGMGSSADRLVTTMNRAAESAVVEAKPILLDGIKKMTLTDAKNILTGGDDAATQYFRKTSGEAIAKKFLPKVASATARVELKDQYNAFAGKAAQFGLVNADDADIDQYVTRKAVDGLFVMMAEQEKAIRQNPLEQTSKILKKVFGG